VSVPRSFGTQEAAFTTDVETVCKVNGPNTSAAPIINRRMVKALPVAMAEHYRQTETVQYAEAPNAENKRSVTRG
jgi:hypothetical protein